MPNRPPIRGAVDDRAAALLAHLAQLVLHPVPDAAKMMAFTRSNSSPLASAGFRSRRLHAVVVVRRIQATEGRYSLLDHCCHLSLVGDIAADRNRLVAGGDQFLCCGASRVLMDVRQRDGRSSLREGFGGR
jgi:hypothetical protein